MAAPASFAGHHVHAELIELLVAHPPPRRLLSCLRGPGLSALAAHAGRNDVVLQAYACIDRIEPGILQRHPELDAHARGARQSAAWIAAALSELSGLARSIGDPLAVMKGFGVACHYPVGWQRTQGDIDVLVHDLAALRAWWPILLNAGYAHEAVAVRYSDDGELQMQIAFARKGDLPSRLEVWVGAQATSWSTARPFGADFWQRTRPAPGLPGLLLPAPEDALRVLVGEVNERGQVRLRDVFDFCALCSRLDPSCRGEIDEALARDLPAAHGALMEVVRCHGGLPWPSCWMPSASGTTDLPYDLPGHDAGHAATEGLRGVEAIRAGRFVSFGPASEASGPFALAETEFGAALRTPHGTFLEQ